MENRTLLLSNRQIEQKLNRLAFQIYEDNQGEPEIILAGVMKNGYDVAEKIADVLGKISPLKINLVKVNVDKHNQVEQPISLSIDKRDLSGKSVMLIDDVMNSGKTMMYALKPFLQSDIKKIRTVVLIDRNHKRFPIAADFTGMSLSTTLQDHISVEMQGGESTAWLS